MTARVVFTAGFSRRYTGGVREFEVEAKNLRGVIKVMDQLYPGLGHHLEEETTVAIDGALHETGYFQPIRPGCEIFFISQAPRRLAATPRLSQHRSDAPPELPVNPRRFGSSRLSHRAPPKP